MTIGQVKAARRTVKNSKRWRKADQGKSARKEARRREKEKNMKPKKKKG